MPPPTHEKETTAVVTSPIPKPADDAGTNEGDLQDVDHTPKDGEKTPGDAGFVETPSLPRRPSSTKSGDDGLQGMDGDPAEHSQPSVMDVIGAVRDASASNLTDRLMQLPKTSVLKSRLPQN
jgi:hypothetical protein